MGVNRHGKGSLRRPWNHVACLPQPSWEAPLYLGVHRPQGTGKHLLNTGWVVVRMQQGLKDPRGSSEERSGDWRRGQEADGRRLQREAREPVSWLLSLYCQSHLCPSLPCVQSEGALSPLPQGPPPCPLASHWGWSQGSTTETDGGGAGAAAGLCVSRPVASGTGSRPPPQPAPTLSEELPPPVPLSWRLRGWGCAYT